MPNSMYLVVVLALLVLAPIVPALLRRRDFIRQVQGRRPVRTAAPKAGLRRERRDTTEGEILAGQARLKSIQNMNGGMNL